MSVLGRPAASDPSSPGQYLRLLGLLDNLFLNGLVNFFVDKCLLAPGRGVSRHPKKERKEVERKPQPLETIGLIRCISLPKKEEGKGAAASVQTITKKMVGMSTGQ